MSVATNNNIILGNLVANGSCKFPCPSQNGPAEEDTDINLRLADFFSLGLVGLTGQDLWARKR